jgi:hypothetical protein
VSSKTWIVQAVSSPEMPEKICCESILDAARAWADRMFRHGMVVRSGTIVLVRCVSDPVIKRPGPGTTANRSFGGTGGSLRMTGSTATIYRVKISMVDAPTFRASLEGVANEGDVREGPRGE